MTGLSTEKTVACCPVSLLLPLKRVVGPWKHVMTVAHPEFFIGGTDPEDLQFMFICTLPVLFVIIFI